MPVVRAGLGNDIELPAGRVAVLRAELIREQRKFRHRFLNDRLRRPIHIQAIVVHPIDREPIEAWTRSSYRTTRPEDTALLRCRSGRKYCKFFYVPSKRVHRQFVHYTTAERRAQFGRLGLD